MYYHSISFPFKYPSLNTFNRNVQEPGQRASRVVQLRLSESFVCTSKMFSNASHATYNRPLAEYVSGGADVLESTDFVTFSAVVDQIQIYVCMH